MPTALKNQRLLFMGGCLGAVLAARQQALADHSRSHPTWGSEHSLEHFAQSLTALIEAPLDLPEHAYTAAANDEQTMSEDGPVG
jgi:hypothetical protein